MHKAFEFNFEWDPTKATSNYRKHGITFERAATVFNDPKALTIFDEWHGGNEERWITLGLDAQTFFVVVHHTYREKDEQAAYVRIISARKATKKEIKQFQENLK